MAECSSEELVRVLTDPSNFFCLSSRGEAIGLTVVAVAGLLSLLGILYIFYIIVRNVRWRMLHLPTTSLQIFHQPMDVLMASLLLADVVQAIGAVMNLKWVQAGKVEVGTFCSTQGIIKIFGAAGVAFSTLAITVYTFLGVWAMVEITSMKLTLSVVVTLWILIAALAAAALTQNHSQNIMGPAPFWCWLHDEVGISWKLAVEYLWLWVTLAFSFLVYIPLYLWMRGNLVIDENAWWRLHFRFSTDLNPEIRARRLQSLVMLAYPFIGCVCILPQSAVRWTSDLRHLPVPSAVRFFAGSLFALSGFFNAILLLKTRPSSGLFGQLMFRPPARPPSPFDQPDVIYAASSTGLGRLPPDSVNKYLKMGMVIPYAIEFCVASSS